MEERWKYLRFDPRRIEKNVPYRKVNKTPIRTINKEGLWPYVAKMQSGDVYLYFDPNPKLIKGILTRLCKEFTNGSLEENKLKVIIKSENDGVILLKY